MDDKVWPILFALESSNRSVRKEDSYGYSDPCRLELGACDG